MDNQCFALTASPARTEESNEGQEEKYKHYTAWGHSTVINPWGEVVGTCGSDEEIVVVDLELGDVGKMRQGIPVASQNSSKHLIAKVHSVSRNIAPAIPTIAPADIKATKLGLTLNDAGSQI